NFLHGETYRIASSVRHEWEIFLLANVGNVKRAMLPHPARCWRINIDLDNGKGHRTKMSPRNHLVLFGESQHYVINAANSRGTLDDGIEDRLHVRGRTADDAEHLGRCRLMLQGLAQFCIALLKLLEQPYVFHRDHRLVSKGGYEIDLLIGKSIDSVPPKDK